MTKLAYDLPFDVGDTLLTGRFKNRKCIVKGFGKNKLNQPIIFTDKGIVSLFPFRVEKLINKG